MVVVSFRGQAIPCTRDAGEAKTRWGSRRAVPVFNSAIHNPHLCGPSPSVLVPCYTWRGRARVSAVSHFPD
jgi:hypothetical protein